MLYRTSWFPGEHYIANYIFFIMGILFLTLFIVVFRIENILRLNIQLISEGNKYFTILIFLFLTSILFYNFQEISRLNSIGMVVSYFIYFFIFFIYFPNFLFLNKVYFKKFIKFISNLGFFCAFLGLLLLFSGIYPVPKYETTYVSFIIHPNNVSIIFTYTAITTLYYFLWQKKSFTFFQKVFYLTSFFTQIVAQFYSFTRAGMIATLFGLMIFLFFIYRRKFIIIFPILVFGLSSIFVSFFVAKGFSSFIGRFLLLLPAYKMITISTDRLLWGYGVSNAMKVYKEYMEIMIIEKNINDPHNSFAYLIMMFGLLFTLLILFFIGKTIFKGLIRVFKTKAHENYNKLLFFSFLVSILISLMLHGLFDAELVKTEFYSLQFFLIFLSLLYYNTKKSNRPSSIIYDQ